MNTDWHGWERVQRQSPALYSLVPLFLWGCATRVAAGIGRAKLLLSRTTIENSGGSAGASPSQGVSRGCGVICPLTPDPSPPFRGRGEEFVCLSCSGNRTWHPSPLEGERGRG